MSDEVPPLSLSLGGPTLSCTSVSRPFSVNSLVITTRTVFFFWFLWFFHCGSPQQSLYTLHSRFLPIWACEIDRSQDYWMLIGNSKIIITNDFRNALGFFFFLLPMTVKISFSVNLSNSWWETVSWCHQCVSACLCLCVPVNEKCRSGFWPKAGNH